MDRIAERQTELVLEQSDNFHNMVNQSELRIRAELNMIEERFRQTNSNIVSAVDELKALISLAGSYSHSGHNIPVPDEVDVKKTRWVELLEEFPILETVNSFGIETADKRRELKHQVTTDGNTISLAKCTKLNLET